MTGGKQRLLSCYPVLSAGLDGINARSLDVRRGLLDDNMSVDL